MRNIFIYLLAILISGCSIIGANIDDELGTDGENSFTELGFEIDSLIIQGIFLPRDAPVNNYHDYIACGDSNMRQVCTALKGCWCEQRLRESGSF